MAQSDARSTPCFACNFGGLQSRFSPEGVPFRYQTRNAKICQSRGITVMTDSAQIKTVPALMTDVLDTIVADPFRRGMAEHLGFETFQDFLDAKNPDIWTRFEMSRATEGDLSKEFFADPQRTLDVPRFKNFLLESYDFLPGVENMISVLRNSGIRMHAFSNYPIWFTLIEKALRLERNHGVRWTFVSCCEGLRKPDPRAYKRAAENAFVEVTNCVLIDDRQVNCDAALDAGFLAAVRFESADQALDELRQIYAPFVSIPEVKLT